MYCCFSGHRPQMLPWGDNESDCRCNELKSILCDLIDECIHDGIEEFFCGMARGIDTYAAEIILKKKMLNLSLRLHAALPCPQQPDGWSDKDRARYFSILEGCDSKTVISPMYTDACMLARNRFMVDNSERLIAVWNGSFRGGTAYTVRYAKKTGCEVYLLRPNDLSVSII